MSDAPPSPLKALLEANANSPLAEVDPQSLDTLALRAQEIFNIEPLALDENGQYQLTDEKIAAAVQFYVLTLQSKRMKFIQLARAKADADINKPKRGRSKSIDEELRRQAELTAGKMAI